MACLSSLESYLQGRCCYQILSFAAKPTTSYAMKPKTICEIFSKVPTSQHYHISLPFLQTYYKILILLPSFSLPPRLIIIFLFKKLVETSIQDWIENYVRGKREPLMIQVCLLKRRRREVKVDPKLGGQWNVPSLVVNGMWRKNTFSPLPTFPPIINLQFFNLEILLYHGSRLLLMPFLRCPRSINYDYASRYNKSFTPSLSIWFWLKIWLFSFPWNHGVAHGHILRVPSRTSKWRIASGFIFISNPNVASSWWRTRTSRGVCSSWVEPHQA
jgi:hypothetical protein